MDKTIEEYKSELLELQRKNLVLESKIDILETKVNYATGCFTTLEEALRKILDTVSMAKTGVD